MFWIFGRAKEARRLIAKAVQEHVAYEAAHVERLSFQVEENLKVPRDNRGVHLEPVQMLRELGEYDPDQKIERIVGEVTKAYWSKGRKPPKDLRELVRKAVEK